MRNEMKKTEGAGASMANALKKAGAIAAGAFALSKIVGGVKDVVNTFATFEQGMANVKAVSGATGDAFTQLSNKAKEMGAKTSKTAAEAADGLQYLALAGWDTEQMLQGIEPVLRLSEAGQIDLGRASDLVTDSMSALGIQVSELPGYLDKVAQTSRRANTNIDALMEGFLVAGGTFKTFNVPLEESNALMGILANRGFKGAEAGTAMNAIVTNLTSGAGAAGKAMKELNISAFDSQGRFKGLENVLLEVKGKMDKMTDAQKAQYISMIAGKEHMKTFTGIMDGLGAEYGDLKSSIAGADGALMDMANTQMDTFTGSMTLLSSAIDGAKLQLGEKLAPTIRRVADWITKYIPVAMDVAGKAFNKVGQWLKPLNTLYGTVRTLFAGDAAGAGFSLAKMFGMDDADANEISSGFGNLFHHIIDLVDKAASAYKSFAPDIMNALGSVGKTIKAIVPLAMKFGTTFWQALLKVSKALLPIGIYLQSKLWPIVSKVFGFIANDAVPAVSRAFTAMLPSIISVATKFGATISALFNFIKPIINALVGVFNFAFPIIKAVVLAAIHSVSGIFNGLMTTLGGVLDFITGVFTGDWGKAWEGVRDIFSGVFSALGSILKVPINAVIGLINQAFEKIGSISIDIPDWVPGLGGKTFGVDLPQIPMLAEGAITTGPTLAMIGEGAEQEAVLPLSKLESLLDSRGGAGSGGGGAGGGDIYVEFSPHYNISGGADVQQQVAQASELSLQKLEQMLKKLQNKQQRVSLQ